MVFRTYIIFVITFIVLLFTNLKFLGVAGIVLLIFILSSMLSNYLQWKNNLLNQNTSINARIKSIQVQKENFRIIESIFGAYSIATFLKKFSIVMDDIHTNRPSTLYDSNEELELNNENHKDDYIINPSYSSYSANIFYRDR